MKEVKIAMDAVGDLDKNDACDMFQVMQNKDIFNYCFFNCAIYLFSKHVNGFFEFSEFRSVIYYSTNLFSCKDEAESKSACITMSLCDFDFIEIKNINGETYIRSSTDTTMFNYCRDIAMKFCKEFNAVLSACLDPFKSYLEWKECEEHESK